MVLIVLVVLFTMVMFLWLLSLLGTFPRDSVYNSWIPWFACLFLGIAVFLVGSGVVTYHH